MSEHDGAAARPRWGVVGGLGVGQILGYGASYYLIAVLADPIGAATGWGAGWIDGGASLGFLVSGLASPRVGRLIEAHGGRPVLTAGAALLAAGLALLALAPDVAVYLLGWVVIGLGMAAALYDSAFAALGRLYGERARGPITQVTLFGGFASTVCWPLTAVFVAHLGWRGACLAFAAVLLAGVVPLYLLALPRESVAAAPRKVQAETAGDLRGFRVAFWLVAASTMFASLVMTLIAVHLLTLLQARGVSLETAVALGTLIGPAQVGGRVLEIAFARRQHPVYVMLFSTVAITLGIALLIVAPGYAAVAIVLYAIGSGIRSIVRGTVPLALFGREGYATLIGRLAMPSLVTQAAAPSLGVLLHHALGTQGMLWALLALAVANIVPAALLIPYARRRGPATSRSA